LSQTVRRVIVPNIMPGCAVGRDLRLHPFLGRDRDRAVHRRAQRLHAAARDVGDINENLDP
jgi:hypothetical protein